MTWLCRCAAPAPPTTAPANPQRRVAGGTIKRVAINVSGEPTLDLEREAYAIPMREQGPS